MLALMVATPAAAQPALASLPLEDPAYVQLDGLARQGCLAARVSPYRPYFLAHIREALRRAERENGCAGLLLAHLRERFLAVPAMTPVDSSNALRTITGETYRAQPPNDAGQLRLGAALTVRATGLSKGEFRPLWRDVRGRQEGDPPVVGLLRGRVSWEQSERLAAVVEILGQSHRRNDPRMRARALRTTSGSLDFTDAYLNGRLGPLVLSLGRSDEAWLAEGRESLMLSAHGPPLDRILASIRWRRFEGRSLFGTADDVVLDTARDALPAGSRDVRFYRYIAAHALTWRARDGLELTLGETALLGRGAPGIDLPYVNPLMIYLVNQNDTGRVSGGDARDNLTVFGAVRLQTGVATLGGELLVDDIQIDSRDRKTIPDQLATRLELSLRLPLVVPASARAEYRRIGSYTYLRGFYSEVYQRYDEPVGSELGPAADQIRVEGELWPSGRVRLSADAGVWRRGGLRIDERPSRRAAGHAGEAFPSVTVDRPLVQKALLTSFTGQWLGARFPLTVRVEAARITNVNNGSTGDSLAGRLPSPAFYVRAQLSGTYAFRYP